MNTHYNKMGITPTAIRNAEKVLADNGIEQDEVKTVLQAIGYVLLDCELYPAPNHPDNTKVDITKWTEILTNREVRALQSYAAKRHWGFNRKTLTALIRKFEKGTTKTKCKVYFLIEDCNFHEVARLLAEGNTAAAYEWAKNELP